MQVGTVMQNRHVICQISYGSRQKSTTYHSTRVLQSRVEVPTYYSTPYSIHDIPVPMQTICTCRVLYSTLHIHIHTFTLLAERTSDGSPSIHPSIPSIPSIPPNQPTRKRELDVSDRDFSFLGFSLGGFESGEREKECVCGRERERVSE